MAESTKKHSSSFRKFLPNIFFKSKDKNNTKDLTAKDTLGCVKTLHSNQYENPHPTYLRVANNNDEISESIYENLSTSSAREIQDDIDTMSNGEESKHSSSSTLVSASTEQRNKNWTPKIDTRNTHDISINMQYASSSARPQVPPKPQNENIKSQSPSPKCSRTETSVSSEYPDVYYHSLEKLSDKIAPVNEIPIYKTTRPLTTPASVGAEIKKVSTTFLISPKKEAEVRTIQPTRARSFSLEKESLEVANIRNNNVPTKEKCAKKAYNYSAPTSPTPTNHKIPNMPATVSPYGSVRKSMNEAEEKKNSLNRPIIGRHLASPKPSDSSGLSVTYSTSDTIDPHINHQISQKEKTRQQVEAFYWQKLKELKLKEDDYLLQHSLNATELNPYGRVPYANSLRSTPSPQILEPRSCSLPRGVNLKSYALNEPINSPFTRGSRERRTDSSIRRQKCPFSDQKIVYRHPEKLLTVDYATVNKSVGVRQSPVARQEQSRYQVPKRVSFEENASRSIDFTNCFGETVSKSSPSKVSRIALLEIPPKPPVRINSVGCEFIQNRRIIHERKLTQPGVMCNINSESESGSEAGEIQKILESAARKGESIQFCILYSQMVKYFMVDNCEWVARPEGSLNDNKE